MERVHANTDVVSILANGVGQVLVDSNTACLKGLRGDLLLFIADKMGDKREEIYRSFLGSNVVDFNFGFRHTTAVAGFDVWLVLLVTVATEGTATHG